MAYYDNERDENIDFDGPLAGAEEDEEMGEGESGILGGEPEEEEEEGYE